MTRLNILALGTLAMSAAAAAPLLGQGSSPSVQLAFGYECGDRFLVRNEGNNPVVLEYATAGSQDKSQLHLNANSQAEVASAQPGNLELWVGGKMVASEPKGNVACGAPSGVSVRPLNQSATAAQAPQSDSAYSAAPVVVYAPQTYGYPYDQSWYYPYSYYPYYGYSPFYYPSVSIYGGFGFGRPLVRGGGFGGGFGRGRGGRR